MHNRTNAKYLIISDKKCKSGAFNHRKLKILNLYSRGVIQDNAGYTTEEIVLVLVLIQPEKDLGKYES